MKGAEQSFAVTGRGAETPFSLELDLLGHRQRVADLDAE
jgi:hypothetical protein